MNYYRAFNSTISLIAVLILKIISLYSFTDKSLKFILDLSSVALLFSLVNNIGNPLRNILNYIESINSTTEIRKNTLSLIKVKEENCGSIILDDFDLEVNNLSLWMANKILDNFTYTFKKGDNV